MSLWPKVQLRRLFRVVNGGTPTSDAENWGGRIPWATPVDLGRRHGGMLGTTDRTLTEVGLRTGSATVPGGSLVISTRAPVGYVAETQSTTAFNQGCRGLTPHGPMDVRFYRYALESLSHDLQAAGQGSTFVELSSDALARQLVAMPPLAEQRVISNFLDTEIARIDALVTKKGRMVTLLRTRVAAEISQRIQAAAPVRALKRFTANERDALIAGPFGSDLSGSAMHDSGPVAVYDQRVVISEDVNQAKNFVDASTARSLSRFQVRRGDVLVTGRGTIGRVHLLQSENAAIIHPCLLRVRADREKLLPEYLALVLRWSREVQSHFELCSTATTIGVVYSSTLADAPVRVPPLERQEALVAHVGERLRVAERGVAALQRQIALLQERRQALITAAVTGELEVAGAAA